MLGFRCENPNEEGHLVEVWNSVLVDKELQNLKIIASDFYHVKAIQPKGKEVRYLCDHIWLHTQNSSRSRRKFWQYRRSWTGCYAAIKSKHLVIASPWHKEKETIGTIPWKEMQTLLCFEKASFSCCFCTYRLFWCSMESKTRSMMAAVASLLCWHIIILCLCHSSSLHWSVK